jgi:Arc/MetJ family transcription regulator
MRTNVEIDDKLIGRAMELSGARTKREAVDMALRTLVRLKNQEQIRRLRGIGWEGDLEAMRLD